MVWSSQHLFKHSHSCAGIQFRFGSCRDKGKMGLILLYVQFCQCKPGSPCCYIFSKKTKAWQKEVPVFLHLKSEWEDGDLFLTLQTMHVYGLNLLLWMLQILINYCNCGFKNAGRSVISIPPSWTLIFFLYSPMFISLSIFLPPPLFFPFCYISNCKHVLHKGAFMLVVVLW